MIMYSEKEIADYVDHWFDITVDKPGVWNQSPLGKIIKNRLTELGRWRNKRRGKRNLSFLKNKSDDDRAF